MIRQIIVPTQNTFVLHIPDDLVGKSVEVIVFSADDISTEKDTGGKPAKRTLEDAEAFYDRNSVDFSKINKWNREDLYE